jgi:nucleoside-diphosphate-sugar epimerase
VASSVLITGAAGVVGTVLWEGLAGDHSLSGLDRRRAQSSGIRRANVLRPKSLARSFERVDTVIDLATGTSVDLPWNQVWADCEGRVNVLEAAKASGVRRYIFASSNHVTGMYELESPYAEIVAGSYGELDPRATPLIGSRSPPRPDGPYAVGKVLGETASRYYAERYGLSCICLRIGTVNREDRPLQPRHFATLLSHSDLVRIADCAIRAPRELRYGVYYGVSANTWRFWDIANAREELGYVPQDDAERFRSEAEGVAR